MAGGGMSQTTRIVRSGFAGEAKIAVDSAGGIHAVGVSTAVQPGRGRSRSKTELDEKIKKPVDSVRKKTPPARKAPSRGRYVDEYARPAI
jgi:hypothetical protein